MSIGDQTVERIKRAKRANYRQHRHAKCIVCGNKFEECGHTMTDAETIINAVKLLEALRG